MIDFDIDVDTAYLVGMNTYIVGFSLSTTGQIESIRDIGQILLDLPSFAIKVDHFQSII